ncbi:hypothetical protein [Chitinilyticum aquatile]|uniref:hypothetical protein n=1 Tax=Chitinilyticum aquatile TaxID=362520 RepID=UPI00048B1FE8|nr:hypothetical protein [Chitinilyticum aquatile]
MKGFLQGLLVLAGALLAALAGFFLFSAGVLLAWPAGLAVLAGFWLLALAGYYWRKEGLQTISWCLLAGSGLSCFYLWDRLSGAIPAPDWLGLVPGPVQGGTAIVLLSPFWLLLPLWARQCAAALRGEGWQAVTPDETWRTLLQFLFWLALLLVAGALAFLPAWNMSTLALLLVVGGLLCLLTLGTEQSRFLPAAPGVGLLLCAGAAIVREGWPQTIRLLSWSGIGLAFMIVLLALVLLLLLGHLGWVMRGRPVLTEDATAGKAGEPYPQEAEKTMH